MKKYQKNAFLKMSVFTEYNLDVVIVQGGDISSLFGYTGLSTIPVFL